MRIILQPFPHNPTSFMRQCGYAFDRQTGDEISFMRRVAGYDYPRFHAYVKTEQILNHESRIMNLIINLHLDQKQPSYPSTRLRTSPSARSGHSGWHAHGGDYDSEIVSAEATRIQQFFAKHAPYRPRCAGSSGTE